MHFVNDMLDFSSIQKEKYEKKLSNFNPNQTFYRIIELFTQQVKAKQIVLSHQVNRYLSSPRIQGERTEPLLEVDQGREDF